MIQLKLKACINFYIIYIYILCVWNKLLTLFCEFWITESNPSLDLLTSDDVAKENAVAKEETAVAKEETVSANDAPASNDSEKPPPKPSLFDVIIDIILSDEKEKYPDEIKSNACMFLDKASKASSGPRKYIEYNSKNSKFLKFFLTTIFILAL